MGQSKCSECCDLVQGGMIFFFFVVVGFFCFFFLFVFLDLYFVKYILCMKCPFPGTPLHGLEAASPASALCSEVSQVSPSCHPSQSHFVFFVFN